MCRDLTQLSTYMGVTKKNKVSLDQDQEIWTEKEVIDDMSTKQVSVLPGGLIGSPHLKHQALFCYIVAHAAFFAGASIENPTCDGLKHLDVSLLQQLGYLKNWFTSCLTDNWYLTHS